MLSMHTFPPVRAIEAASALVASVSAGIVLAARPSLIPPWLETPPVQFLISVFIIAAVLSGSVVAFSARTARTTPRITGLRVGLTWAATVSIVGGLFWTAAGTWGFESGQSATLALAELLAALASFAAAWIVGVSVNQLAQWRR
jgi:hypothetical protein